MYEELLKACGLTKNESLVYLALLRIGKSKSGEIVKEAKISSGKIYETLQRLSEKGLVKSVEENGVKNFTSNEPETLLLYLKEKENQLHEKENQLKKIIPELKSLKETEEELESVSLLKGIRGISTLMHAILKNSKEIKIMGVRSSKKPRYNTFWMNWHKERIKQKKQAFILFSDKDTEYWKFFKSKPYTKVREMLHFSPSAMMNIDDNLLIFSYDREITCIHIQSQSIVRSFSNYFDDLWKIAEDNKIKN